MLLGAGSGFAQDIITLINGKTITAKVEEITDSSVKYRKFSNLMGPIYTLDQDKIGKITFENGEIEYFKEITENKNQLTNGPEVEKNQEQSDHNQLPTFSADNPSNPQTNLNEYELLKMADTDNMTINFEDPVTYKNKAKRYKKVAWIFGGILFGAGVGVSIYAVAAYDSLYLMSIGGPLLGAGIGWCVGWNITANKLLKKAQLAEMYSMSLVQTDEIKIGKSSIVGSLNIMGDRFTKSNALGLGITLKL